MKKITSIILLLFASFCLQAQATFDTFETNDKVSAVVVNKKMFELMAKIKVDANDISAQNYLSLIKNLDYLRVLSTTDSNTAKQLLLTTNNYLAKNPLDEAMRSSSNGKIVKIYVKSIENGETISELVMLIEDQSNKNNLTIMTLLGKFSMQSLSVLTDKMNLPGSKEIKDLSKK